MLLKVDDLVPHGQHRAEGGHRILGDHRDIMSAQLAALRLGQGQYVAAVQSHLARADSGIRLEKGDQGCGEGGLAAAAFAHDADHLPRFGHQADAAKRVHVTALGPVGHRQFRNLQKRAHRATRSLSFGSSASRNPSPRKVNPSVQRIRGMPPAITMYGADRSEV